jgi:glycosyltransferase involved in cell wall biosynthesis
MRDSIKISVITVCRNSEKHIAKCINSVLEQKYPNIEYIIIDGASTDGTLDVINQHSQRIDKIISEPDGGIFDAMNKGVDFSSGDYILFLNADDYFISDAVIGNIADFISDSGPEKADVYYGKVFIYNRNGGNGFVWKAAKVSKYSLYRGSIPHPATVYSKNAFIKCGHFDTSYEIAGDYEWTVKAYLKCGLIFLPFDMIVSVFLKGGISTDIDNKALSRKEIERIRNTYFSDIEKRIYRVRWFFRKNFKFW